MAEITGLQEVARPNRNIVSTCVYCTKVFQAQRSSAAYCSDSCRVRASRDRNYRCFYCGDMANQRDHVIPHTLLGLKVRQWKGVDTVECCGECNNLLGANLFATMADRIGHLANRFRIKHKLSQPHIEWDEEELLELSDSLARYIAAHEKLYWQRWRRLQHMRLRIAQMDAIATGDDPDEVDETKDRKA